VHHENGQQQMSLPIFSHSFFLHPPLMPRLPPPPPPSHPNMSWRWLLSLFQHDYYHHHLLASKCEPEVVLFIVSTQLPPQPPPSHPNTSRRWFFLFFRPVSHHHLPRIQMRARGGSSGKCTLSPGHPRTAQDVLETQRHQRYKVSQVAPRAKSKMLTSLRHPGSFLGHPGPSWVTLRYVSLAIFRIFSCLSYLSHFSKLKYTK